MVLHTLQIEHTYLLLVYTLLALANARLQKGMQGVNLFVLYNALALLGSVAVVMRGDIPDFLSIVVGNVCVMAGYTALYASLNRFFPFPRKQHAVALGWLSVGVVSMVWLGAWHPDTGGRLLLFSAVLGLQQLHLAALLLFGPGTRRRLSWMPITFLLAMAVANAVRVTAVLRSGAPADYRAAGPILAAIVLANACLQCGLMVSYVWMTAAQLRGDLERLANADPLTGLLNRRALETAALHRVKALSEASVFSVILLDLDCYKPINDRLGHAAGDQALIAVAQLLSRELGHRGSVARTGGDEFMALLPGASAEQAMVLAEEIRLLLKQSDLGLGKQDVRVTGSFGVAEAVHGQSWDELCRRCDRALYVVKGQGGNAVHCDNAAAPTSMEEYFLAIR